MSVTGRRIGKRVVRFINGMINFGVLLIVLLLVIFSCYALWDSNQIYHAADAAQYEIYKPRAEDEGLSFGKLQKQNPEVFAWLTVYGTHIDYPIAQGENNMKYVNTNAFGDYSLSGSIFLDCGNAKDFSDYNSILYGHHMEKQAMFGEIGLFSDQNYFEARRYGNLYYQGTDHGLEFFAFLHADAYDKAIFMPGIKGTENQQAYLNNLLAQAKFTRDIGVTTDDQILLLSTCSSDSTNGRDILVGRVTSTRYQDTFNTNKMDTAGGKATVDSQSGPWAALPLWLRIAAPALALLILLILVLFNRKKKRTSSQDHEEDNKNEQTES